MKNYSLCIFIGIGLMCLVGVAFFVFSPPQYQALDVKVNTVPPEVKSRETFPSEGKTVPQTSSAAHQSVGRRNEIKMKNFKRYLSKSKSLRCIAVFGKLKRKIGHMP